MRGLLAILVLAASSGAGALGLGDVQGRAIIGRPLHLEIPVVGAEDLGEHARCIRVLPEGDDADLVQMSVRMDRRKLILTGTRLINQPVFRFKVRIGCPAFLEESYVVLADPPERVDSIGQGMASGASGATQSGVTKPLTVASPTTLRMMSRQRYPGNSATRVRFIQSVAAANPDVFASESVAYDQVLLPGTVLKIPLAWSRPVPVPAVAASAQASNGQAESRARTAAGAPSVRSAADDTSKGNGKGRLVIGSSNLPAGKGPTTAELSEAVERLTAAMNEQAQIEIAALERLKVLEGELSDVKRRAAVERAAIDRLEGELRKVQEQAERDNTIKLVLVILLGGILFAVALRWMMDRRNRQRVAAQAISISPVGMAARKSRSNPADLEELLPPLAATESLTTTFAGRSGPRRPGGQPS